MTTDELLTASRRTREQCARLCSSLGTPAIWLLVLTIALLPIPVVTAVLAVRRLRFHQDVEGALELLGVALPVLGLAIAFILLALAVTYAELTHGNLAAWISVLRRRASQAPGAERGTSPRC